MEVTILVLLLPNDKPVNALCAKDFMETQLEMVLWSWTLRICEEEPLGMKSELG
jgi:hypothetical protein